MCYISFNSRQGTATLSFDLFLPFCLTLHYFLFYNQALLISSVSLSFFLSKSTIVPVEKSSIQKGRLLFIPIKGFSLSLLERMCMCVCMYTCVCVCVCVLLVQSYSTLCDFMNCYPPVSPVHGILQASILECVVIPFPRGSSNPRIEARSPALQADSLSSEPPGKSSFGVKEPKFFIKKKKIVLLFLFFADFSPPSPMIFESWVYFSGCKD